MGNWLTGHRTIVSAIIAAVVGVVGWSGHVVTLPVSFAFLLVFLMQPNRRAAYTSAVAYYLGASWAIVPGANTFFGQDSHVWQGVMLWLIASPLLATPWGLFHFRTWPARFWSVPLALAATTLPPLGLIGWASPLTSAGILFPGTSWLGIVAVLILPGAIVYRPGRGLALTSGLFALTNTIYPGDPAPSGWEAVDTTFGRCELALPDPTREFRNAEWIQQRALKSKAKVIVFPESVAPRWNEATEAFWEPSLRALAANNRTILFGTTIPVLASEQRVNGVIIQGNRAPDAFFQRVPPPISMWKPLSKSGFPLRLTGRGTVRVADERAGVLICYELLLTWPVLSSSFEHPTILVGVANDYWASHTSIPAMQRAALTAWARLFSLPKLMAVNT